MLFFNEKAYSQFFVVDSILIIPYDRDIDLSDCVFLKKATVYHLFKKDESWYFNNSIEKAKAVGGNIIKILPINGMESNVIKIYKTDSLQKYVKFYKEKRDLILNDSLKKVNEYYRINYKRLAFLASGESHALLVAGGGNLGIQYKPIFTKNVSFGPYAEIGGGIGFLFYTVCRVGLGLDYAITQNKDYHLTIRANREWYRTTAVTEFKAFSVPLRVDLGIKYYEDSRTFSSYTISLRYSDLLPWYFPSFTYQRGF